MVTINAKSQCQPKKCLLCKNNRTCSKIDNCMYHHYRSRFTCSWYYRFGAKRCYRSILKRAITWLRFEWHSIDWQTWYMGKNVYIFILIDNHNADKLFMRALIKTKYNWLPCSRFWLCRQIDIWYVCVFCLMFVYGCYGRRAIII